MDLRKFKNTEVLIPQKKSKVLDITYQYASVTELDDNGEIYPIGEKVLEDLVLTGLRYEIAKNGYVVFYGVEENIAFDARSLIFAWVDKDKGVFNHLYVGQDSPSYIAKQETPSGVNISAVGMEKDRPVIAFYDTELTQKFITGKKDKVLVDTFQSFDSKISDPSSAVVCFEGVPIVASNNKCLVLAPSEDYDTYVYNSLGQVYCRKAGETSWKHIKDNKEFVEKRKTLQAGIPKQYGLNQYNKVADNYLNNEASKKQEKKGLFSKIFDREK